MNRTTKATTIVALLRALLLALLAAAPAQAATPCKVKESDLLGAWTSVAGGYFQEMAFSVEEGRNTFNSWLHQRPEVMDARWTLTQCELRITKPDHPSLQFGYTVALRNGRLELRESGSPVVRYRKIGKGG